MSDCILCGDGGLCGGYPNHHTGGTAPWKFCSCDAGIKLAMEDPEAANRANAALAKVNALGKR